MCNSYKFLQLNFYLQNLEFFFSFRENDRAAQKTLNTDTASHQNI